MNKQFLFVFSIFIITSAFSQNKGLDVHFGGNTHFFEPINELDSKLYTTPYPSAYAGVDLHLPISGKRFMSVGVYYSTVSMLYNYSAKFSYEAGSMRSRVLIAQLNLLGYYIGSKKNNQVGLDLNIGFNVGQKIRNTGYHWSPFSDSSYYHNSTNLENKSTFSIYPFWKFANIRLGQGNVGFKAAFSYGFGPYTTYFGTHLGLVYQIRKNE